MGFKIKPLGQTNDPELEKLETQPDYVYFNDGNMNRIYIPNYVTVIPEYFFHEDDTILEAEIAKDSRIVEMGAEAFAHSSIRKINLEKVKIFNHSAFAKSYIEEASLYSATYLDMFCFSSCEKLKKVTLGERLTDISLECFSDCPNLRYLKIVGNSQLVSLGPEAFTHCNIEVLEVSNNIKTHRLKFIVTELLERCPTLVTVKIGDFTIDSIKLVEMLITVRYNVNEPIEQFLIDNFSENLLVDKKLTAVNEVNLEEFEDESLL